jgi:hypothetical protein
MELHRLAPLALAAGTAAAFAGCNAGAGSPFPSSNISYSATSSGRSVTRSASGGSLGPVLTAAGNGTITGWDVDANAGIGLLSAGYNNGTRLEVFDLQTAKITKLGSYQKAGSGNIYRQFIVLRVLANDVALVDDLKFNQQTFQRDDTFPTVSPIAKGRVSGRWTPPHRKDLLIDPSLGWVGVNQDTATNLVLADRNIGSRGGRLELIDSDVATDSFVRAPRLGKGEVFEPPYVIAQDTTANQLVVPMQLNGYPFNPFEPPSFEIDDLSNKTQSIFSPGLGSGSVMGVAIDSTTHMMCTTTSDDSNVEFVNLSKQTGFAENLPNGAGEGSGGGAVAVDELNHLFIVTQPAGVLKSASVYVYDEQGNLQESITGFDFENVGAAVFAYVAVNPNLRIGYATTANGAQLQSFSY